jgi:hypothetical protein
MPEKLRLGCHRENIECIQSSTLLFGCWPYLRVFRRVFNSLPTCKQIGQHLYGFTVYPTLRVPALFLHVNKACPSEFLDVVGDRGLHYPESLPEICDAPSHLFVKTAGRTGRAARNQM